MSLQSLVTLCVVLLSGSYAQSKLHLCAVEAVRYIILVSRGNLHASSYIANGMYKGYPSLLTRIRAFSNTFGQP